MPRKNKTDKERDWFTAAWGELDELGEKYAAHCEIVLSPTTRKGIFHVAVVASVPGGYGDGVEKKYKVVMQYPTASTLLFLPWVWDQCRKLGEMVDQEQAPAARLRNEGE